MNATTDGARRLITEEIPVAGTELLGRVRALLEEGRVRHIKVKSPTGEVYFEVPLSVGLLGGAALAWASPFLAMAGALAGMVTSVKLEVARDSAATDAVEAGMHAAAARVGEVSAQAKRLPAAAKRAGTRAVGEVKAMAKRATGGARASSAKAPTAAAKRAVSAKRS